MDIREFRRRAVEVIDYIADYLESISERPITSSEKPGFLHALLPSTAPNNGESFEQIMEDLEKYIMPGLTHWQHPRFHAYFPANSSYPSILAETIASAVGPNNFNWIISRSENELETMVLDWYGKMIGLPDEFLYHSPKRGGGFIRNTISECTLLSMIAARQEILEMLKQRNSSVHETIFLSSLVAYCSNETHSCVEKAAKMLAINIRALDTDDDYRFRGEAFAKAIEEDKKHGLVPFFACATLGTTTCCSCDPLTEIGPLCEANGIWLHVDGAYGGTALMCPEYKHLSEGMEYASTFVANPAKWMLISIDCAVMWTKHPLKILNVLDFDETRVFYGEEKWCYPTIRRSRALKLWFVIRTYGVEGLQMFIRNHVRLAKMFENLVREDNRFEVFASQFGLVCFRLNGSNSLNKRLLTSINVSGKLHITSCNLKAKYVMRFCVCSKSANESDIKYAWSVFREFASELLKPKVAT